MDNFELAINNINVYQEMSWENSQLAYEWWERAYTTEKSKSSKEHADNIAHSRKYAIVAVLMSAFAAEAYINDYAVRNFSNSFFDAHLDKLDFLSKWVVIPQLVTGKPFPKEKSGYQKLHELKRWRDKFAHAKTRKIQDIEDFSEKEVYGFIEYAFTVKKVLEFAINDLMSIDGKEKSYLFNETMEN